MSLNLSKDGSAGKFKPAVNPLSELIKKKALEAEAAKQAALTDINKQLGAGTAEALQKKLEEVKYTTPSEAKERIKIIFDDSGSMSGAKFQDAKDGCIEFLRNCQFNQTAVAVYPMNRVNSNVSNLTTNLPQLSVEIQQIPLAGSTPLFEAWRRALTPDTSRFIIFSDGDADYAGDLKEEDINYCREFKIPCDTVYIAHKNTYNDVKDTPGYRTLKEIADRTGGICLIFERGKVNFKTAFKYLAPVHRLSLAASVSMQKDLQEGKLT